jgi:hypothetical protein
MGAAILSMKDWRTEGGGGCVVAIGIAAIFECRWTANRN